MQFRPIQKEEQNEGLGRVPADPIFINPVDNPYPTDNTPKILPPNPPTGGNDSIYYPPKPVTQTPVVKTPVTPVYTPPVVKTPVTPVYTPPVVKTPVTPVYTPTVQTPTYTPIVQTSIAKETNPNPTEPKTWIKGLTNFQTGLIGFGLLAGTATVIIVVATPTKKGKK